MERLRRTRSAPRSTSRSKPEETYEETYEEPEELDDDTDDGSDDGPREGETEQEAADRIRKKYRARATTPLRAIRAFCVICMGDQVRMVAKCTARECPLFGYRMGTKPKKGGEE